MKSIYSQTLISFRLVGKLVTVVVAVGGWVASSLRLMISLAAVKIAITWCGVLVGERQHGTLHRAS